MAKRIITISREFGSGGRFIGEGALCDHWKKCRLYTERPGRCAECIYSWGHAGKNKAYHWFIQCKREGSCENDGRHR